MSDKQTTHSITSFGPAVADIKRSTSRRWSGTDVGVADPGGDVKWSHACSLFDRQKKKILNEKEGKVEQKKREEGAMETYQYVHEDKEEEEEDTL